MYSYRAYRGKFRHRPISQHYVLHYKLRRDHTVKLVEQLQKEQNNKSNLTKTLDYRIDYIFIQGNWLNKQQFNQNRARWNKSITVKLLSSSSILPTQQLNSHIKIWCNADSYNQQPLAHKWQPKSGNGNRIVLTALCHMTRRKIYLWYMILILMDKQTPSSSNIKS